MAGGSRSSSSSHDSLPMYKTQNLGLANDYISVGPQGMNDIKQEEFQQTFASARNSMNFQPPPFPPPGWHDEEVKQSFWQRHGHRIKLLFAFVFLVLVSAGLLYPVIRYRETEQWTEEETPEISQKQLYYHIFLWLFISWINAAIWFAIATAFPHVFRIVSGILNPGQQKYWHIFKFMIPAITLLGTALGVYISYVIVSG
jgi:hypothetical protein